MPGRFSKPPDRLAEANTSRHADSRTCYSGSACGFSLAAQDEFADLPPIVNARTAGVYLRADPEDQDIMDETMFKNALGSLPSV